MKKRLLSWLLSLSMCVGTLVSPVWAEPFSVPTTVTNVNVFVESVDDKKSAEEGSGISEEIETVITEAPLQEESSFLMAGDGQEQLEEETVEEEDEVTGYPVTVSASASAAVQSGNDVDIPSETEVYQTIMAKKSQYPEGMSWTNSDYYGWNAGVYSGGYGCAGFAFLLSDAAFGNIGGHMYTDVSLSKIHVGDILRINNNTHMVIVLEVRSDSVIVAEGNYGGTIHWGREVSSAIVDDSDYMISRYPIGHFTQNYSVSYNANGGSGVPDEQIGGIGYGITISTTIPTRFGYEFKGWSTSSSSTIVSYKPGSSYTKNTSVILYAVWSKFSVQNISNTFPQTLTANVNSVGKTCYYQFTPNETADYSFESSGGFDTKLALCDNNGIVLASDDDSAEDGNFLLVKTLAAGETYQLHCSIKNNATGIIMVTVRTASASGEPLSADSAGDSNPSVGEMQDIPEITPPVTPEGSKAGAAVIKKHPESVIAALKQKISFEVVAENAVSYQWEFTKDGKTWKNSTVSSATSSVLNLTVSTVSLPNTYRCRLTGEDGNVVCSRTATITEIPTVRITKNPKSAAAVIGTNVEFSIQAENVVSYQWQYSKDGAKWISSTGNGNSTDTLTVKTSEHSNVNRYRCKCTGSDGSVMYSEEAVFVILDTEPQNSKVAIGKSTSYSLSGSGIVSYQWEYSKDGVKWIDSTLASATTSTLKRKVSDANKNYRYRCKVSTAGGKSGYTVAVRNII